MTKGRTLVLCYHAVSEDWRSELAVTPGQLTWQVAHILRRGYRPVTFIDAMTTPANGRRVAITFDDAYRSVFELALPVLRRLGAPATVYAPTDWIDRDEPMRWAGIDQWVGTADERELVPMSWEELRRVQDEGWEVGSHTCSHPHLTHLDDARLSVELSRSKDACEEALDRPCRSLAYPYGDEDDRVLAATVAAGYAAAGALPTVPSLSQTFRWPRVGIYRWDGRSRFVLKLSPTVAAARGLPLRRWIDPLAKRIRGGSQT